MQYGYRADAAGARRYSHSMTFAATVRPAVGRALRRLAAHVQRGRRRAEALAQLRALEDHFRRHAHARPTVAELAQAAAELDGYPSRNVPTSSTWPLGASARQPGLRGSRAHVSD